MCETCNDTGLTAEGREGTRYPYTCRDCEMGNRVRQKGVSRRWEYFREVRDKVPVTVTN